MFHSSIFQEQANILQLNYIENLFSQLKNHIKNKSPDNYQELKLTIDRIFKNKIKEEHLKNYFNYLFIQANSYIDKNLNIQCPIFE